jgi:hypothetical protein
MRALRKLTIYTALFFAVSIGLVFWLDSTLLPDEYSVEGVRPETFKDGKIVFFIPYSGGDQGSCKVDSGAPSIYPLGSKVLVSQSRILGKCVLSPLPDGWKTPPMCCDLH